MKFELAFEALRHGYCITVQENKSRWYRWDQEMQSIRAYVNSLFMSYKLDFPTDRIMTDRWQVGVYIEGNSPLWLDIPYAHDIEQIMQYAEIALEEREQRLVGIL
jgi:hypothetical protein